MIRLAGIFAHPDDDAYGIGGTLAQNVGTVDATIVLCTSGGAGPISDPSLATRDTLTEIREAEERESLRAVGHPDAAVHFLRYDDYHLNEAPREELVRRVESILREAAPHVVVTFGPDGVTSHHDHIAAGEIGTEAFHRARPSAPEGTFERLYHMALRESLVRAFYEGLEAHGLFLGEPGDLFLPRGIPDDDVAVSVDCSDVVDRKLAGIAAHRTQAIELEWIPEELRGLWLSAECFIQAWPRRELGTPVRRSLFDDLPAAV